MEQRTVVFLGPQGCGKGTQVNLLKEFLKKNDSSRPIVHFEAGEALRTFGREEGYTQDMVRASMARGELQPDFVTTHLMSELLVTSMKDNEHLIFDGFPRTREQEAIFNTAIKFYRRKSTTVFVIEISDEVAIERLLKRARYDDTKDGIRNRLAWTRAQIAPVIEWFKTAEGYQLFDINGERSIEAIHADILAKLNL
ncbi:MAG: nucleoside monophosphate kinase [Patescibacteria group bacterium]|nr:nucleoside monophosphate kinase [Patescibacteria group bacterium]